jgi:hypothetical protein
MELKELNGGRSGSERFSQIVLNHFAAAASTDRPEALDVVESLAQRLRSRRSQYKAQA